MKLPKVRNQNIVIQEIGDEIMIYDLEINKAYCLNETSAIVYQNCDGETDFTEIKTNHNFSDELISFALEQLNRENLLEKDGDFISPFKGFSRREVIKKIGLGSIIALPVVASIVAPTAVNAQSCNLLANGQTTVFVCTSPVVGGCSAGNVCGLHVPGFDAGAECCSGTASVGTCTPSGGGEQCSCVCS